MAIFLLWFSIFGFTYLFFADVYLRPLSPGVRLILGFVRTLVSGTILFLYGELALRLGGCRPTPLARLLLLVAPGISGSR